MSNLIVKDVEFNGASLKAAQYINSDKVYICVKSICDGIGLSEGQTLRQITNIQSDLVISKGIANLQLPTNGGVQSVLCIDIDFLPLWLAKISITPRMKEKSPEVVERLVDYQLKAKDVLAKAFIYGEFDLPKDYKSAVAQLLQSIERNEKLQSTIQDLAPKAQAYIDMMTAHGYVQFIDVAAMVEIGRTKLLDFLRKNKVLTKQSNFNVPYGRFTENGCFKVIWAKTHYGRSVAFTMVSPKGIDYIYKLIRKRNATSEFNITSEVAA